MTRLSARAVLEAKDFQEEEIEVPEWGGSVKVRSLSTGAVYTIAQRAAVGATKEMPLNQLEFAKASLEFGVVEPKLTREEAGRWVDEKAQVPVLRIVAAIWRLSDREVAEAKNA